MKTIGLKDAYGRLGDCVAVIVDNDALVYPSLSEIENDPKNQFLYLSWENKGKEYSVKCIEQNNQMLYPPDRNLYIESRLHMFVKGLPLGVTLGFRENEKEIKKKLYSQVVTTEE